MSDDPFPTMADAFPPPMSTGSMPLPHDRMTPAARPVPTCPDCAAQKCRGCAGVTLDEVTDELVACEHVHRND